MNLAGLWRGCRCAASMSLSVCVYAVTCIPAAAALVHHGIEFIAHNSLKLIGMHVDRAPCAGRGGRARPSSTAETCRCVSGPKNQIAEHRSCPRARREPSASEQRNPRPTLDHPRVCADDLQTQSKIASRIHRRSAIVRRQAVARFLAVRELFQQPAAARRTILSKVMSLFVTHRRAQAVRAPRS